MRIRHLLPQQNRFWLVIFQLNLRFYEVFLY